MFNNFAFFFGDGLLRKLLDVKGKMLKDSQYLDCGEFLGRQESDLNRQMYPPIQVQD